MRALLLALAPAVASVAMFAAATVDSEYVATVRHWRSAHETSLRAEDGWLTLAGLFWLKDGPNIAGTAAGCNIRLPPGSVPDRIGEFDFRGGVTMFRAASGVPVTVNGKPVVETPLKADPDGVPDLVQIGGFTMLVIHRGNRYAVRLKNKRSPTRLNFTGLRWFPVNEKYHVIADFHAYPQSKLISIPNILGETEPTPSPGYVSFSLGREKLRLDAAVDEGRLFFIFRDLTASKTTYGSGRFLKADMAAGGKVTLDFNEAYNPPCAFTPYATCPLPPASNRLAAPIPAGEMKYGDR